MRGPYGNAFPVDQFENKDLLVICGGTGMSPVKTTLTHFTIIRRSANPCT